MIQKKLGSIPSPFDCWLLTRSTRNFPHRMRMYNENAMELAHFLETNKKILKIDYSGLKTHKNHDIAATQMNAFGGDISLSIDANFGETLAIVSKTKIIRRATRLGGIESLWEHRRSIENDKSKTPENLIRLSVGLENVNDLIEDLEFALK